MIAKWFTGHNNPIKIRLPYSGKKQVAPIKIQVVLIVNYKVYDDCMAHGRRQWNINGMRSNESSFIPEKKR